MRSILIIDDDAALQTMLHHVLAEAGYEVVEAADGSEAIKLVQVRSFDLVLCDLFMPKKEGLETIKGLRSRYPALPIVAMSGGAAKLPATGLLSVALTLGATAAIQKPFSVQELLALVRACLPE